MKICIVSDSHDRSAPLVSAIVEAQAVIHCGTLIGLNTLRVSLKLGLPIHAVYGNPSAMSLHFTA
jgi:predicted phosphodiesterase